MLANPNTTPNPPKLSGKALAAGSLKCPLARGILIKSFPDSLASPIDKSQTQTLLGLWQAFSTDVPDKVDTGSGKHCKHIVDLVSMVRHAIDPESALRPVGQVVEEQKQWLLVIKDHNSSSLMIEQDDFEYAPFNQFGGIGLRLAA